MNTLIEFVTEGLGDNIAFSPYPDLYQKKYGGKVYVLCKWFHLFESKNENVIFIKSIDHLNFDKKYKIFFEFRDCRMQKLICDQLGLEYFEIKPSIKNFNSFKFNKKKKYICIGFQSTAQMKYWNNSAGWSKLIRYLKKIGYDIYAIDKDEVFGNHKKWNKIPEGAINETGNFPLEYRIEQLKNCSFFIGLSSGLAWLAYALNKKVVLISGCTKENNEFEENCYRVINKNVCHGCLNDSSIENISSFLQKEWFYCPRNKDFECTKQISFEMVKEKIDQCIKDLKISS